MKLSDLRPLIKDSETYAIAVSNDLGSDCVIREVTGLDLKSQDPDPGKSPWRDPPLEFLMNQEVESVSSRVQGVESDDYSRGDGAGDPTVAEARARFESETVIRLSLSEGQLDGIRKRAWADPAPAIKAAGSRRKASDHGQAN